MVVKTGSFTSVVVVVVVTVLVTLPSGLVVVVVTVSVTLPSGLVVVDDVDSALTVVPVDSVFAEVFPPAAIGADIVVPFGATVVAVEVPVDSEVVVPVDSVEPAPVEVPVDSVVVVPVDSAEVAPVVAVPVDSAEVAPVAAVPVVSVEVVPVDSVVVAPSVEDALVEAPLSVAEAVVPSVEDDAAPEALDSLEVPSEEEAPLPDSLEVPSDEEAPLPDSLEVLSDEEALLPDSLATPVFSFVPSARAVIGDAMTAALKVAAAIPISFE